MLQAEKAKQLLYQAKYGRFGLGDPFVALQRDAVGTRDSNFDEAAVKSMYDNQLAQLENLIATQRKAQLKMREQLANAEKRYHKVSWLKAFIFEHSVFVGGFLDKTFESWREPKMVKWGVCMRCRRCIASPT